MINDLLNAMAADMHILKYRNESDVSFACRLCYSALGQWCLNAGRNKNGYEIGTTKHNQTYLLNELLARYVELFPTIADFFVDTSSQPTTVSVFIRRTYEETGYLLTDENNHNKLANFGRTIEVGNEALFFGLPHGFSSVHGLGIFTDSTAYKISIKDFLIRDRLSCEEYYRAKFDAIDFFERDIDLQELEFFNPLSKNIPSQSWNKNLEVDCTIARKFETGPYYRIIKTQKGVRFADEPIETQTDNFTSYEYRRLYFALKSHYNNPLGVWMAKLDDDYVKIRIGGHLPNREYYFLLLLSWPERSAFDKTNFIIKSDFLPDVLEMLENIGLEIKGGCDYE